MNTPDTDHQNEKSVPILFSAGVDFFPRGKIKIFYKIPSH